MVLDCGTADSNIPASTDSDQDGDGVASAYELHIGTDCKGSVDNDYIGADGSGSSFDATITVLDLPPEVQVVAAGIGTYTQIDTGVTCNGDDCNNLKAFIVSSGLTGNADDNAVSMVTGIVLLIMLSSNPTSCWVDDVDV